MGESTETQKNILLWNPSVALWWSLLFTPIFGAWVHAKNWISIGDEKKAKESMYWVYGGIVMIFLAFVFPKYSGSAAIGYFFGWYFSSAKQQIKFVKEKLEGKYNKKGWGKPLGIAIVVYIGYIIIAVLIVMNFNSKFQTSSALEDISGVWRANTDGAIVTLRVAGKNKTIEINGKSFPVSVKNYDNVNKITTFIINNNPTAIWTIRQLFNKEGEFTLDLTLHDGSEDELSFVRNL